MKFIDFFDQIYITNLPERIYRLRHVKREIAKAGIPFKSDKVKLFSAVRSDYKKPFHKLGSKGNFLGTLEVLKRARDAKLSDILIFPRRCQISTEPLRIRGKDSR